MFIAIFGAGASYDADPDQPRRDAWRPPLASQLVEPRASFGEALRLYPQAVPIVGQLRNLPANKTLEQQLQALDREARTYAAGAMHVRALRFYLRYVTWYSAATLLRRTSGVTNYTTLLAILDNWLHRTRQRAGLLTFNYDPLLDDAVQRSMRMRLETTDDYIGARPDVFLAKLHGSANWLREVDADVSEHQSITASTLIRSERLKFKNTIVVAAVDARGIKPPRREEFLMRVGTAGLVGPFDEGRPFVGFPAIALPLRTKGHFECPEEHVNCVGSALAATTRLLVVGWRGEERHFLKVWAAHGAKFVRADVVAGSVGGAQTVVQRFRDIGVTGDFRVFAGGFSEYVRSNALRGLLGN